MQNRHYLAGTEYRGASDVTHALELSTERLDKNFPLVEDLVDLEGHCLLRLSTAKQ